MNLPTLCSRLLLLCAVLLAGCANIVPPSGGKKDITPPRLVSVTPADSLRGVRTTKVVLRFDEYVQLTDPAAQIRISPLLPVPLQVTSQYKHVTVSIPDSLLLDNTTYRITFGTAIRDLHEGNIYEVPGYIFSTGSYFDSLRIGGQVLDASTGLPDSSASVLLYLATDGDSAIVRRKPLYVTHTDAHGGFSFEGLPARTFRIYALRDANNNLTYDGGKEWVAFLEAPLTPRPDTALTYLMRTFPEGRGDTTAAATSRKVGGTTGIPGAARGKDAPAYQVLADTSDARRRTQEVTGPLLISFARPPAEINRGKLYLTYDSSGITVEAPLRLHFDTARSQLQLATPWKENALYTLRLQKGFAKDSAGNDLLPGRYTFRTKRDEDYARLGIHLPGKYYGRGYVLQVTNEHDTLYQQPVLDTMVNLVRIQPGTYTIRVIEDRNQNGRWDTGDLFRKEQPELVIPYLQTLRLKPGWEDRIDFELPAPANPLGKLPGSR